MLETCRIYNYKKDHSLVPKGYKPRIRETTTFLDQTISPKIVLPTKKSSVTPEQLAMWDQQLMHSGFGERTSRGEIIKLKLKYLAKGPD